MITGGLSEGGRGIRDFESVIHLVLREHKSPLEDRKTARFFPKAYRRNAALPES